MLSTTLKFSSLSNNAEKSKTLKKMVSSLYKRNNKGIMNHNV